MKNITIVIPEGPLILSSIIGPYKVFNKVNEFLIHTGKQVGNYYNITLAGTKIEKVLYDGAFSIKCDLQINEVQDADLIIIPSLMPSLKIGYKEAIERNQPTIDWVRNQYNQGVEVASLCTGALLLAGTGIVDGK